MLFLKQKHYLIKVLGLSTIITLSSLLLPKPLSKEPIVSTRPSVTSSDVDLNHGSSTPSSTPAITPKPVETNITLSFAGDCTLGADNNFGYPLSFTDVFDKNEKDFSYFFKGVKSIFENDDLSIVNLETTFTNATTKRVKEFNFKGGPSYTNILLDGDVEVVNLANNHTYDYSEQGYNDTIDNLNKASIGYYGNNIYLIKEVKGIKIGFAGFTGFNGIKSTEVQISEAMKYFDEKDVDLKIVSFHWGIERDNYFNDTQEALGKYAIDNGADLVIGHHPHVLQGIEEYKDSYIVYSLGNFVFGGNKNPSDKDSMIFQQTFNFVNDELVDSSINIIPVSISSKTNVNDYQPTILEGDSKTKVLNRINKYSKDFTYEK
jgi:poly-gamma-glutamate synthesis protein (capsule biosynthesis protein)